MKGPIFIDSNVPMYLIGSEHPLTNWAVAYATGLPT